MDIAKAFQAEQQLVQARLSSRSTVESVVSAFRTNDLLAHVKNIVEDALPSGTAMHNFSSRHDLSSSNIDEAYADGGLDPEDEKLLLHLKQHYHERLSDEW